MKNTARPSRRIWAARAAALVAAVLLPACYSHDPITLEVTGATPSSVSLSWNSPIIAFYDGSPNDHADSFELRYSDAEDASFETMIPFEGSLPMPTLEQEPKPSATVTGLQAGTTYTFVLRCHYYSDYDGQNYYADSNWVQGTSASDPTPPGTITDLHGIHATESMITVEWTAPGEDDTLGKSSAYDLRYSKDGPILTDQDFEAATQAQGEPLPQMVGGKETCTIQNLPSSTAFWFAIRAADDGGNKGALAVSSPMMATAANNGIDHAAGDARGCGGSAAGLPAGLALALLLAAGTALRR